VFSIDVARTYKMINDEYTQKPCVCSRRRDFFNVANDASVCEPGNKMQLSVLSV
jgi:hypothetical protein